VFVVRAIHGSFSVANAYATVLCDGRVSGLVHNAVLWQQGNRNNPSTFPTKSKNYHVVDSIDVPQISDPYVSSLSVPRHQTRRSSLGPRFQF